MNVQALSDQVLLNHYLSGDQGAISKLIERHSRRVRDYINMMVKDRDVAEDIFQETFIKAVRVIDDGRYTDNGKFLSWILRIAHNQVIDHFRAQRRTRPSPRLRRVMTYWGRCVSPNGTSRTRWSASRSSATCVLWSSCCLRNSARW